MTAAVFGSSPLCGARVEATHQPWVIPAVRGFWWRRRLLLSTVVVLGLACQLAFLIALMHCVFLEYVRVWRRLAWVCRHTFYIMVYLCVFRYRL